MSLKFRSFKGSGKRALLDVISRRAEGSTRGQVLLNGSPLTKALFQQRCGYVTQSCTFIPGLTVAQTLHYTPTIVSNWKFNIGKPIKTFCFKAFRLFEKLKSTSGLGRFGIITSCS